MGIGVSIFLMAVGAILAFAVHVQSNGIDLATVGVILMILGVVGLLASLVVWDEWMPRRRTTSYDDVVVRRGPRVIEVDENGDPIVEDGRPVVERRVTTRRTGYSGY